jgi:hypothetical protein
MPKGALAKPSKGAAALMVMNRAIEEVGPAIRVADRYRGQWEAAICVIGLVGEPRHVETARKIHNGFLAALPELKAAESRLFEIEVGRQQIDRVTALAMLNVLFAAIGKRKNDEESMILLAAAADMFNPVNDVLASAGLLDPVIDGSDEFKSVKPINRHPAILAIAIKKLIATAKFTSCAELREAMADVQHVVGVKQWHLGFMTEAIDRADAMLFEKDRAAWDEIYANVDSKVVLAMREWSELAGEGPSEDEDENGNPEYSPSPRWQALDDLVKAKAAIPKSEPRREAACKTTPAKRTRKPKLVEV